MDQAGEPDDSALAGADQECHGQGRPQANPHPSIADPNRELCRLGVVLIADVTCGAEALAGFEVDGNVASSDGGPASGFPSERGCNGRRLGTGAGRRRAR